MDRAKTEDQRRFRRYAVSFPCLVRPGTRKATLESEIEAETRDVSSGGLFFVGSADWELGTEIACELNLPVKACPGSPVGIQCRGQVVRVVPQEDGRLGVGIIIRHYKFFHLQESEATS
ncbi:MAG: PilZ domain-containing protein [Acidobacteria bacterium]|nr:PilZ domain-containing protein [Acidobacteriota bacterium]